LLSTERTIIIFQLHILLSVLPAARVLDETLLVSGASVDDMSLAWCDVDLLVVVDVVVVSIAVIGLSVQATQVSWPNYSKGPHSLRAPLKISRNRHEI